MSETPKKGPTGWTEAEKLGLIFQIITKMGGAIPWSDLELPEGRTMKACQVMIDKEKAKVRNAANGGVPATPASGKKRGPKAAGMDGEDGGSTKKAKTPRSTKEKAVKAASDDDDDEEVKKSEEPEESVVKSETTNDEMV